MACELSNFRSQKAENNLKLLIAAFFINTKAWNPRCLSEDERTSPVVPADNSFAHDKRK
jgi:hypothetical protein